MTRDDHPNVVFVLSDQHRGTALGCADDEPVETPNIDRLAAEGTRFSRAYATTPLCAPSRASLMTGRYPDAAGVIDNGDRLVAEATTLGEVFSAAGYHTAYVGKWHLSGEPENYGPATAETAEHVISRGFDRAFVPDAAHAYFDVDHHIGSEDGVETVETEGYAPAVQTDYAIEFLRKGNEPWCLVVSYGPPHNPYEQVPDAFRELYDSKTIPLRPNVEPILPFAAGHPEPGAMWAPPTSVGSVDLAVSEHTYTDPREGLGDYYAGISAIDHHFGRLLDGLAERDATADTVVTYTADHGDQLWSQGHAQKGVPYEESIRVPLLIRWPEEVPADRETDAMIGLIDLVSTLCGLVGVDPPEEVAGTDFSVLVRGESARGRKHVPLANDAVGWYGVRTPRYTYARTESDGLAHLPNGGWLLFDNDIDPHQLENRLYDPEHRDAREECDALVSTFLERAGSPRAK